MVNKMSIYDLLVKKGKNPDHPHPKRKIQKLDEKTKLFILKYWPYMAKRGRKTRKYTPISAFIGVSNRQAACFFYESTKRRKNTII
jgi:hypothetical protein